MKEKVLYFKNNLVKLDWIIAGLLLVLVSCFYFHGDLASTTYHSMNLWNCIADGNSVFDFYSYNYMNGEVYSISNMWYQVAAIYDFPLYLIFAIWNLPLWLLQRFAGIDVLASMKCLLYAKLLIVVFVILVIIVVYKICRELNVTEKNAKLCVFIFITSSISFTILSVVSQYDIIGAFFTLCGILSYLKGNKRKFILWFMIAISLKYFALLIFIPLVLLREKRILYFVCDTLLSISLTLIISVGFSTFGSLAGHEGSAVQFLGQIFSYNIGALYGNLSIFAVLFILLCIWCYAKSIKLLEEQKQYVIWIAFLAFASFFTGGSTNVYWIILILPYICILTVTNKEYYHINLLLETVISLSAVLSMALKPAGQFNLMHLARMLISKITGSISQECYGIEPLYMWTQELGITGIASTIMNSAFVAGVIAMAYINFPRKNKLESLIQIGNGLDKVILYVRIVSSLAIVIAPIIMYISLSYK